MKINGNEIRPGNVIQHNGELWVAIKLQHVKPGKGGAFAQIELKNLINGSKLNERFRSADKVERVRLEQTDYQFLYESDDMLVFMDTESYEQIELQSRICRRPRRLLQDGMNVVVESHEGKPIGIRLPDQVTGSQRNRSRGERPNRCSSNKPAICDNGVRVMVPPFIEIGDKIIVDTNEVTYLKRAD